VASLLSEGKNIEADIQALQKSGRTLSEDKNLEGLDTWWATDDGISDPKKGASESASKDEPPVKEARLEGGRMALTWTAAVPATMALGYLLLILYFRSKGGYTAEVLTGHGAKDDEKFTGGTEGPGEY